MGIADIRQKIFAIFFSFCSPIYDILQGNKKSELFSKISQQKSYFPDLRKKGALRIIELGAGTGPNIKHMPKNAHVIALDINDNFRDEFMQRFKKEREDLTCEGYVVASATDMKGHIPDASVDAVVSTAVGCMVPNVEQFHSEILRILVPGGKFYFIEHIKARGGWSALIQNFFYYSGIGPIFMFIINGCDPYREPDKLIQKAGFSHVDLSYFRLELTKLNIFWAFFYISVADHLMGVATK